MCVMSSGDVLLGGRYKVVRKVVEKVRVGVKLDGPALSLRK